MTFIDIRNANHTPVAVSERWLRVVVVAVLLNSIPSSLDDTLPTTGAVVDFSGSGALTGC